MRHEQDDERRERRRLPRAQRDGAEDAGGRFSCALPCTYDAQVVDAQTGEVVSDLTGKAVGDRPSTSPPTASRQAATSTCSNLEVRQAGTGEARFSRAFTIPPGAEPVLPPSPPLDPTLPHLPQALFALPTLMPTLPPAA